MVLKIATTCSVMFVISLVLLSNIGISFAMPVQQQQNLDFNDWLRSRFGNLIRNLPRQPPSQVPSEELLESDVMDMAKIEEFMAELEDDGAEDLDQAMEQFLGQFFRNRPRVQKQSEDTSQNDVMGMALIEELMAEIEDDGAEDLDQAVALAQSWRGIGRAVCNYIRSRPDQESAVEQAIDSLLNSRYGDNLLVSMESDDDAELQFIRRIFRGIRRLIGRGGRNLGGFARHSCDYIAPTNAPRADTAN